MQEFELVLTKQIRSGLRQEYVPKSDPSIIECFNIEPGVNGLEPYKLIKNPAGLDIEGGFDLLLEDGERLMLESAGYFDIGNWPFPQIFIGSHYTILAERTKIYSVNSQWICTEQLTVPAGDVWDFIDFGTYIVLLNGEVIVYVDPTTDTFTQMASSSTFPRIGTGCNFKGQIVGGDVRTTWEGCGRNSVIYSDIGSASFTLDRKNEAGFRHGRRKGDVKRVGRLGDGVIVYGENFVDLMVPFNQYFQIRELLDVGIYTKSAAGITNDLHVFVDSKGYLWKIDREFKLTRLGYQEFMLLLNKEYTVVSGVQDEQRFYISDGNKCYMLNPKGLCEVHQMVSSVSTLDDAIVGTFLDTEDYEARLTTGTMDFGHRGMKTMAGVEAGLRGAETIQTAVDLKYTHGGSFTRTPLVLFSPDGFAYPNGTGHDIRVHLKADDFEEFYLDYLNCKVKLSDRRFAVRGPYRTKLDVD